MRTIKEVECPGHTQGVSLSLTFDAGDGSIAGNERLRKLRLPMLEAGTALALSTD